MRNRKKHKTIDDFSVSQLLDDFLKVDAMISGRAPKEVDDEDYIRMMLKKDVQKKLERTKRETQVPTHHVTSDPHSDTIDDNIRRRFFPDVREKSVEKDFTFGGGLDLIWEGDVPVKDYNEAAGDIVDSEYTNVYFVFATLYGVWKF